MKFVKRQYAGMIWLWI